MKKRRFLGPAVISILLCALVADSLYFADAPWSVVGFTGKFLSGFGAIVAPAFDPANYGWLSSAAMPLSAVAAGFVILLIAVVRAKSAMRRATPAPGAPVFTQPASATQGVSKAGVPPLDPGEKPRASYGFFGKLTFSFCAISAVFAISAGAIIYSFLGRVMDQQVKARADAMTFGIGEIVTSRLRDGSGQDLSAVIGKYASADGVAFVYIEDRAGKIIAQFPKDLPIYLDRDFPRSTESALRGIAIGYRGAAVYETAKRIEAGKIGFVHLGFYRSAIEAESRRAFAPIAALMVILLIGSAAVFTAVAHSVNQPFSELVFHADQISKGAFAVPLAVKRADEIGEIARSLERLRSSLRAVVSRLDQKERAQQQPKS